MRDVPERGGGGRPRIMADNAAIPLAVVPPASNDVNVEEVCVGGAVIPQRTTVPRGPCVDAGGPTPYTAWSPCPPWHRAVPWPSQMPYAAPVGVKYAAGADMYWEAGACRSALLMVRTGCSAVLPPVCPCIAVIDSMQRVRKSAESVLARWFSPVPSSIPTMAVRIAVEVWSSTRRVVLKDNLRAPRLREALFQGPAQV